MKLIFIGVVLIAFASLLEGVKAGLVIKTLGGKSGSGGKVVHVGRVKGGHVAPGKSQTGTRSIMYGGGWWMEPTFG
ncbi:uncharacterized protein PGTG_16128 [Puccinia graminis f. sp. tritici CRL 75-36-700-3]|uniref:Uncharacterized protein n=1 Tax=Puccinia graminis f. sp. tritici (strain CRL 75-36-700-3 / race SCCL) TaxID=418459 RepID=E3L1E3_PUCGT|nr:uncharacterized protein PGTG_16128 [Puccinia graminis f. sp. tritici CRL 75-36-700-3]EFP90368.1 hypothetical protein PGTG_16128 [Puccinia graminis f. sp. tritici CRL 75-36-700-3]